MNFVSTLVPAATAAVDVATQQVGNLVRSGMSFADLLQDRLLGHRELDGVDRADPHASPGPAQTPLGDQVERLAMLQRLETLRQNVQRELLQRLNAEGVDLSEPAILIADQEGRLLEQSGHWDRAKIEQLLTDDPQLGNQVRQLLKQATALQTDPAEPTDSPANMRLVVTNRNVLLQVV